MRKFVLFIIVLFCSLSLLSSCQWNKQSNLSIIGRWDMMGNDATEKVLTLCMYEDSTFTMSSSLGGVPQSGEWEIYGDTLKCYGNRNSYSGRTKDYYEFIFKIVRHNEKELYLGDFDSQQVMEFKKIHD